jgi:hypothetical protein
MFLSTQEPNHIYKYLVNSSRMHAEKIVKNKLTLILFKKNKYISLKYLVFIFFIIFSGKIFSKNRIYIKYEGINIGKNINSKTLRNFKSYTSTFFFYLELFKNFYRAGIIIESCKNYIKKNKIKAIYVDHCTYLNGIIFSYFANSKIPVYTNNYPLSIFMIDFRKKNNLLLSNYDKVIKFSLKKSIKKKDKIDSIKVLKQMTFQKNYLSWMKRIKFKNLMKKDYKKFDYVVYAHSFTDGQLVYGNDEFQNTYDWLDFTLNELKKRQKKVLIKGHPNFYEKSYGVLSYWDKKIFRKIINKYSSEKNFLFLNSPIFNFDLLKQLDNNCILITHHGTVLLEGAFLNFKTICSESTFYEKSYKHTITWKNKDEYKQLLGKEIGQLPITNKGDLYKLIHNLHFSTFSYYSKNFWEKIIAKQINVSPEEFTNKITIFNGMNRSEKKLKTKFFETKTKNKSQLILKKLSSNITQLYFQNKKIEYSILK